MQLLASPTINFKFVWQLWPAVSSVLSANLQWGCFKISCSIPSAADPQRTAGGRGLGSSPMVRQIWRFGGCRAASLPADSQKSGPWKAEVLVLNPPISFSQAAYWKLEAFRMISFVHSSNRFETSQMHEKHELVGASCL